MTVSKAREQERVRRNGVEWSGVGWSLGERGGGGREGIVGNALVEFVL